MGFPSWNRAARGGEETGGGGGRGGAWLAAGVWMLLVSSAGGAVLVWWALVFHPSNAQLWMVPVGLVVFGTPIIVWLSIFGSEIRQKLDTSVLKGGCCCDLPIVAPALAPASASASASSSAAAAAAAPNPLPGK